MVIVSSSRKKYTPEYRKEAARLVIESGARSRKWLKNSAWAKDFWVNGSNSNENAKAQVMAAATRIYEMKTLVCVVK